MVSWGAVEPFLSLANSDDVRIEVVARYGTF
jgi:hypothetical protein